MVAPLRVDREHPHGPSPGPHRVGDPSPHPAARRLVVRASDMDGDRTFLDAGELDRLEVVGPSARDRGNYRIRRILGPRVLRWPEQVSHGGEEAQQGGRDVHRAVAAEAQDEGPFHQGPPRDHVVEPIERHEEEEDPGPEAFAKGDDDGNDPTDQGHGDADEQHPDGADEGEPGGAHRPHEEEQRQADPRPRQSPERDRAEPGELIVLRGPSLFLPGLRLAPPLGEEFFVVLHLEGRKGGLLVFLIEPVRIEQRFVRGGDRLASGRRSGAWRGNRRGPPRPCARGAVERASAAGVVADRRVPGMMNSCWHCLQRARLPAMLSSRSNRFPQCWQKKVIVMDPRSLRGQSPDVVPDRGEKGPIPDQGDFIPGPRRIAGNCQQMCRSGPRR